MFVATALLTAVATGCEGVIGTPPNASLSRPDDGLAGPARDPRIRVRLWRLTPPQYNHEITRLFGDGAPRATLPWGASDHGITNISAGARVDLGNGSTFAEAARSVGTWAAGNAAALRCDNYSTATCRDKFLSWFVRKAYRRPVSNAEATAVGQLFAELETEFGFDYAVEGTIRAVLASPHFLYRFETGAPSDTGLVRMQPYQIANLLSFSLTDRAPDEQLLADAAMDRLSDPDVREAHARRLMEQSSAVWQRFFWEWMKMAAFEGQANEVGLSSALTSQAKEEYQAFVDHIVVEQRGTLEDLLTTSYTFARPELAAYYGAAHSGSGLARIELDATQRTGLLTQAAWLVAHGKRGRANVVRRGMAIYRDAMCNDIEPLDVDLVAALEDLVPPDASIKEIADARGNDPTCGACHKKADPIGLVFESFAGDGSWQTTYEADGRPVETDTALEGVGPLDSATALSVALAQDVTFQHCLVQRFAHFLVGIDVGSPSAIRWTGEAHEHFIQQGGSFEELLVGIVRDPAFIERRK